jgi:hypothetical protein
MIYRIRDNQGRYLGKRGGLGMAGPRPWVDDPEHALLVPSKGEARDLLGTLPAQAGAVLEPVTGGDEEESE